MRLLVIRAGLMEKFGIKPLPALDISKILLYNIYTIKEEEKRKNLGKVVKKLLLI